jgi:RNA polymerase sporulation-specific sigma factor
LPAPLDPEEEARCIALAPTDREAKDKLIVHNLRLVVYLARKFENTGVQTEDLISIGTIGLIKAVETFKSEKKIKLATYASRCIENEILMHLRRTTKLKLEVSFEEPLNVDWDGNELLLEDILGTDPDVVSRDMEDEAERDLLNRALAKLSDRERDIIDLRFGLRNGEAQTQKQVADAMGISQSYISRLEKRIMKRLKRDLLRMQS